MEYTLDILLNERLHCAVFDKLNDPFEGIFLSVMHTGAPLGAAPLGSTPLGGGMTIKTPQTISDLPIPGGTRVCSLSASGNDVRLWSHYANGHTGIAIEIEGDKNEDYLHEVEYVDQLKEFTYSLLSSPASTDILRIKSNHWSYEKEFRIISESDFYNISGKITGIYLGIRTSEVMTKMLQKSVGNSFPIYSTRLNEKTINIEQEKQLN